MFSFGTNGMIFDDLKFSKLNFLKRFWFFWFYSTFTDYLFLDYLIHIQYNQFFFFSCCI